MTKSPVACLRPYTYAVPVKANKVDMSDCSKFNTKLLEHFCGTLLASAYRPLQ